MFTEPTQSSLQKHPWFDRFLSARTDAVQDIPLSSQNTNQNDVPIHPQSITKHTVDHLVNDETTDANLFPTRSHPSISSMPDVTLSPAAMFLLGFSPSAAQVSLPDSEGQVIAGYTLGPTIGYGGFSTIRRASSLSGGIVAAKIVQRSDLAKQGNPILARKRLDHEAAVWASISHEHILPLFSTVQTPYADYFFTLYCPAGSLFDILKRDGRPALPHDDVGTMFRQVVRGLRYLHEVAGFVHRDIKLENVLVDEMGVCRIGDFGMTKKIGEDDEEQQESEAARLPSGRMGLHGNVHHLSLIRHNGARHRNSTPLPSSPMPAHPTHIVQPGSLPYASPELLLPQTVPIRPHPAQDMWALGVLLYVMLTGRLPFSDPLEPRLHMKILRGATLSLVYVKKLAC
jgi:serine/threonine protein kinase